MTITMNMLDEIVGAVGMLSFAAAIFGLGYCQEHHLVPNFFKTAPHRHHENTPTNL